MIPRGLGYPLALVALLAGVIPASSCVRARRAEVAQLDALKLHRHVDPGGSASGPVVVNGKARGNTTRSATDRQCLAFRYTVSRSSGKTRSTICTGGQTLPFEVETPWGEAFSPSSSLTLNLSHHPTVTKQAPSFPHPCKGYRDGDTVVETCLLPGDDVQVWGCRVPDSGMLVPCRDRGDVVSAPPGVGPLVMLQESARSGLDWAVLWVCGWAAVALGILSAMVVSLTRKPGEPAA